MHPVFNNHLSIIHRSARSGRFLAMTSMLCLAACSGGGGSGSGGAGQQGGPGEIVIELTDKPFVYDIVEEARISIDGVRIHPDGGDVAEGDDGWIQIYDGPPADFDLLELRNGVKRVLLHADLPAGTYGQIRLHVTSAFLKLINGNEYSTAQGTIHLTSQDTSGFKVDVEPPIEVVSELSRTLLLDFDMTKTFHPIPASDPLTASRYQLHPVIHVANLSESGELRGVIYVEPGGVKEPVANATVYVLLPGETDVENAITATASDEEGSYAVLGLGAGEYDLLARKDDLEGRVDGVPIVVANVTVADIVIQ